MSSTAYFPTLIYKTNIKVDNDLLYNKAISLKNNNASVTTNWFCETYNTIGIYDICKDIEFNDFVNQCIYSVKEFSKDYGIQNAKLSHIGGWFNIAQFGDYQEFHIHPNHHFSLVYYVSVNDDSGNIIFRSPESATDMFMLPSGNATLASMKTVTVKPEVGTLLIFRSNLLHMVEKNKSNQSRVSISFNVSLQNEL
jgi:uncharacterized protein (TIGR02466 family)